MLTDDIAFAVSLYLLFAPESCNDRFSAASYFFSECDMPLHLSAITTYTKI